MQIKLYLSMPMLGPYIARFIKTYIKTVKLIALFDLPYSPDIARDYLTYGNTFL